MKYGKREWHKSFDLETGQRVSDGWIVLQIFKYRANDTVIKKYLFLDGVKARKQFDTLLKDFADSEKRYFGKGTIDNSINQYGGFEAESTKLIVSINRIDFQG